MHFFLVKEHLFIPNVQNVEVSQLLKPTLCGVMG